MKRFENSSQILPTKLDKLNISELKSLTSSGKQDKAVKQQWE